MGIPWKKILNIGGDVAGVVGGPAGMAVDTMVDSLTGARGKSSADNEKINQALALAASLKALLAQRQAKGVLESKRALAAITNAIAVGLIYWGLPPEAADQIAMYVSVPLTGYILGETVRPSVR